MFRLAVVCVMVVSVWAKSSSSSHYQCVDMDVTSPKCGVRHCPKEAGECVDNKCECSTRRGQPELLCSNPNDLFSSILNDPQAWTMNKKEDAELPVPCPYRFSKFKTNGETAIPGHFSKCEATVNLYNKRFRGKLFVGGFEIDVTCTDLPFYMGSQVSQHNVYKVDSYVDDDGKYCFQLQASADGGNTFKSSLSNMETIHWQPETFRVSETTSSARLIIPAIGLSAVIRPYHIKHSVAEQPWLPGFAMKIDVDKRVSFPSYDKEVSLPVGMTLSNLYHGMLTPIDTMTFQAFTGPGNTNTQYPNYSPRCNKVKDALAKCDAPSKDNDVLPKAMSTCRFILMHSKFVNCYGEANSGQVTRMLKMYEDCINVYCGTDSNKCDRFTQGLQNIVSDCKVHVPIDVLEAACKYRHGP